MDISLDEKICLFVCLLFNRNIADDESPLAVALLEIEVSGDGIERFEGECEVGEEQFAHNTFCDCRRFLLGIGVFVERDAVCGGHFVSLSVGFKV